MGRGAVKTGARKLPSLLANAFEAMIGAIFLDQGYRAATKVFLQNIGDLAEWSDENFKGQLQQASQDRTGRHAALPGHRHRRPRPQARVHRRGRSSASASAGPVAARPSRRPSRLPRTTRSTSSRKTSRGGAAAAVGAARDAAKTVASEPARVRRRVAEVAADRGRTRRRRGRSRSQRPAHAAVTPGPRRPSGRRSLLSALRHAAEALVGPAAGRRRPQPTAGAPAPATAAPSRAPGGRGRGGREHPAGRRSEHQILGLGRRARPKMLTFACSAHGQSAG